MQHQHPGTTEGFESARDAVDDRSRTEVGRDRGGRREARRYVSLRFTLFGCYLFSVLEIWET